MENEVANDGDLIVSKLTEKQKETIGKIYRQLFPKETDPQRVGNGLNAENISKEDAKVLQQVIQAFRQEEKREQIDEVDAKPRYTRLSSTESLEFSNSSQFDSFFINPGRFYVCVTEEAKKFVQNVYDQIQRQERGERDARQVLIDQHTAQPRDRSHECDTILQQRDIALYLFPHQKPFRQAVNGGIGDQNRHPKQKKDYSALWKERGNAGWFNLIFTIIGFCAFFADSGTDLKVAVDHFIAGDYWWGTFTVLLVLFPALLVNMVSFFWYKEDEEKFDRKPASGWKVVSVFHLLQLGLIERYWRLLVKGYRIKRKKLTDVWHYQLYVAMNLDIAMLQMFLAFTEDAPQLVLQLYVLIRRHLLQTLQTTSLRDLWTMASIFFSFVSYSRAVVNYIACLSNSQEHKLGGLKWYEYVSMWFWRAFIFTSRILVLVFFATEFHLWFFLVLFLHLMIILALMWRQKVSFFPDERWKQNFIRIVIAYIHTFCFFVLEAGKTIQWAVIFYGLTFVEALVFSLLWYTNYTRHLPLQAEIAGITVIFVCYVLGILMMVVYYKFLQAKFKRPRHKWHTAPAPQEELEEVEEEEDEIVDEREDNESCEDEQRTQRNRKEGDIVYEQFEVLV